jgi:hypothetical protein
MVITLFSVTQLIRELRVLLLVPLHPHKPLGDFPAGLDPSRGAPVRVVGKVLEAPEVIHAEGRRLGRALRSLLATRYLAMQLVFDGHPPHFSYWTAYKALSDP